MSERTSYHVRSNSEIRSNLLSDIAVKAQATEFPQRENFVLAWYGRMERAERRSQRFKFAYYVSFSISSLAAAAVPALIAAAGSSAAQIANVMRFLAAGLGVFVAVTTAVLGVVQVSNRWRVYRTYSQSLEDAGWNYLAQDNDGSGSGNGDDLRYRDFVIDVTNVNHIYYRDYLSQVAVQQEPAIPGRTGTSST